MTDFDDAQYGYCQQRGRESTFDDCGAATQRAHLMPRK